MKFYKLSEVPIRSDDQVFKASPVTRFIWLLVFVGITVTLLWFAHKPGKHSPPPFMLYSFAAFSALMGLLIRQQFRASLKPTNWTLRCHNKGIIIKYRSFLNWHFPGDDVQAVGLDYGEIAWIKTVKERRTSPEMDGRRQTQSLVYLDFGLVDSDTAELESRLQSEQTIQPGGRMISRDYPLEVLPGGIVQLRWKGATGSIRPSVRKAIEFLGKHVKIATADSTRLDLTHQRNLAPGAEDYKIIKLLQGGDKIGAVTLTRQIYKCSLTEAMDFVDKLRAKD